MKKKLTIFALTVILSGFSSTCFAQQKKTPKWVTDKGFWIVESNVHTPEKSTVYFYNPDKVLVYKEQVEGVQIRLDKKKVLMRLKTVLEASVTAWETQQVVRENEMLLAMALKK